LNRHGAREGLRLVVNSAQKNKWKIRPIEVTKRQFLFPKDQEQELVFWEERFHSLSQKIHRETKPTRFGPKPFR
jgi:hypothetical protein